MSDFYEKIKRFRDESYSKINNSEGEEQKRYDTDFNYAKDVLEQLIKIAFFNKANPDTLPDIFDIINVHYTTSEFEDLMKKIGYDVNADLVYRCYIERKSNLRVRMMP